MKWDSIQLGEVMDVKHGYAFKSQGFADSGDLVLLSPGNCQESGGLKRKGDKEKYYVGEFPPQFLLSEGDMLVVMTDLINTAPILGGSFLIPEDNRFLHNQRLGLVQVTNETRIDKTFLYYLLNTYDYRAQVRGSASGATVRHTSPGRIRGCKVRVPRELAYQHQIGATLSAYDDLIENTRRRMTLLDQAARQLYREWFVRLRFPGHEHTRITNGVPEGWDSGTIADFFHTTSGGTPSRSNPDFYTGDINWVKTQELNDDFIFETEERITEDALTRSSAKLFPVGTLLLSIYGGSNIGRTGILAEPAATNQACCALFPQDRRAHVIYGALYFREQREHLIALAQGAAQTNISQQVVRALPMRMAPASLMSAFVESLVPLFEQMKTLKVQNNKLRAARDLLLPRLMSGEVAV
jgi:type I restriction enzyme S subunit